MGSSSVDGEAADRSHGQQGRVEAEENDEFVQGKEGTTRRCVFVEMQGSAAFALGAELNPGLREKPR